MKKVYVVTSGCYSDFGVDAIFSTEAKAQEYIDFEKARLSSTDFNDIAEYDLDIFQSEKYLGKKIYGFSMKKNGDIDNAIEEVKYATITSMPRNEFKFGNINDSMYIYVWASDETQAIKIANDKRIQLIAMNKWGVNEYE